MTRWLAFFLSALSIPAVLFAADDEAPLEPPCFGWSIASHDDLVLIGAPFLDERLGQAYLFRRGEDGHRLLQVIKRPAAWGRTCFGEVVALGESTLVVGEPQASAAFQSDAGRAHVFAMQEPGKPANEPQPLIGKSPAGNAGFGETLALAGNLLAVGEPSRDDGGRVSIMRRNQDDWQRVNLLTATEVDTDQQSIAWFGKSIALDATTLVVGAPFSIINEVRRLGAVFVYRQDDAGGFGNPPQSLVWPEQQADDFFGHRVVLHRDYVAVSAILAEVNGIEDAGVVCVFARSRAGIISEKPTAILTAAQPTKGEGFGSTLALAGRRLVVGTSSPDQGQPGVYVLEPATGDVSRWTQLTRLQGSDPDAGFGSHGLSATDSLIYVGETFAFPRSGKNGQVAVIACESKPGGGVTFRRIETIEMPKN